MYYINNQSIEIEMENGENIHIGTDSNFYGYITRIVGVEQKLRGITEKVIDNMSAYKIEEYIELLKSISNIQERSNALISDRACIYQNIRATGIGNIEGELETFRLQDEILEHELEAFETYTSDPSMTVMKCKDALKALKNIEKSTKAFMQSVGVVDEATQKCVKTSTERLKDYGIPQNSMFYSPMQNSFELGALLEEARRVAENKQKENYQYGNIKNKLDDLIKLNNSSIDEKYKHSNKYKVEGIEIPEAIFNKKGDSYYKLIEPISMKSLETTKTFVEASKKGEIADSELELGTIENLIRRDLNFSREIRLQDKGE